MACLTLFDSATIPLVETIEVVPGRLRAGEQGFQEWGSVIEHPTNRTNPGIDIARVERLVAHPRYSPLLFCSRPSS